VTSSSTEGPERNRGFKESKGLGQNRPLLYSPSIWSYKSFERIVLNERVKFSYDLTNFVSNEKAFIFELSIWATRSVGYKQTSNSPKCNLVLSQWIDRINTKSVFNPGDSFKICSVRSRGQRGVFCKTKPKAGLPPPFRDLPDLATPCRTDRN
jgi:hypothetical protein